MKNEQTSVAWRINRDEDGEKGSSAVKVTRNMSRKRSEHNLKNDIAEAERMDS
ncbi:hypothetical protein [Paenibacillus piri]|uniref:hypothetical protein n=1 Tax=Paenibacillus piri TaxID=2547395 RepID=UPI001404471A|nr:hypothetical protein [Paenibacillus piri]